MQTKREVVCVTGISLTPDIEKKETIKSLGTIKYEFHNCKCQHLLADQEMDSIIGESLTPDMEMEKMMNFEDNSENCWKISTKNPFAERNGKIFEKLTFSSGHFNLFNDDDNAD